MTSSVSYIKTKLKTAGPSSEPSAVLVYSGICGYTGFVSEGISGTGMGSVSHAPCTSDCSLC